jgi:MFS transporter, putative metabolite:H+ symporter
MAGRPTIVRQVSSALYRPRSSRCGARTSSTLRHVTGRHQIVGGVLHLAEAGPDSKLVRDVGRKTLFATCFAGGAISLIVLSQIANPTPEQVLTFISISYFFVNAINLGVYLYTPELYPTRVRALGVGTATAWLRLASMVGPTTVGFMIATGLQSVFLAFGVLAVVTAIVTALFAIETKQRILEDVSP